MTRVSKFDLVSWWAFDEASGNALDSHGTNHLVQTSGTIASVAGIVGNARDIEAGDTEWFAIPDNDSIDIGDKDFAIGIWVKIESFSSSGGRIINKRSDSDDGNIEFQIYALANGIRCSVFDSVSGSWVTAIPISSVSTGVWYFIVLTYNNATKTVTGYCNGSIAHTTKAGMRMNSGTSALVFGTAAWNLGSSGTQYDGLLDEGFLKKKYLTQEEMDWLYNEGAGRSYADLLGNTNKKAIIW